MPSGLEQSCRSGSGEIRIVLPDLVFVIHPNCFAGSALFCRIRIVLPDPVFVIHPNSPDPPLKLPIPHLHQLILK